MTEAPPPPSTQEAGPGPDEGTGAPAPATGAGPPGRRPVRRASRDRVIGGVAAGVARWLGVEPVPVRIGFVVLALVAPPTLLAYVAAWLLLPADDTPPHVAGRRQGAGYWFGILLAGIVVVALAASLDGGGGPLVALALVGVGVALWRRGDEEPVSAGTAVEVAPGTARPARDAAGATTPAASPAPAPTWEPPPRVPRERSALGWSTVGVALLAAGVTVALDAAGAVDVDWTQVVGVAVVVLGLGLVVGAAVGRARWLVLPVVLLLPVVAVGSAARSFEDLAGLDTPLADALGQGVGERTVDLGTAVDAPASVTHGVGVLVLDASGAAPLADTGVAVDQSVGGLRVLLPSDARWSVDVTVGAGAVNVVTEDAGGGIVDYEQGPEGAGGLTFTRSGGSGDGPVLDLDLALGLGEVELVEQAPADLPAADPSAADPTTDPTADPATDRATDPATDPAPLPGDPGTTTASTDPQDAP